MPQQKLGRYSVGTCKKTIDPFYMYVYNLFLNLLFIYCNKIYNKCVSCVFFYLIRVEISIMIHTVYLIHENEDL